MKSEILIFSYIFKIKQNTKQYHALYEICVNKKSQLHILSIIKRIISQQIDK